MFIRFGSPFKGIAPRVAERLLADGMAQIANNVDLTSGEIRPLRAPVKTLSLPSDKLAVYRAEYNGAEKWVSFDVDADIAKAALPADVEPRYYWTGEGEPRYATFTELGTTKHTLGVPTPTAAPSVTPTGGTGTTVTRFYGYTFYSALYEESSISPLSTSVSGHVDGSWAITGMSALPSNGGSVTGVYASGSTTFTDSNDHWLRVGDKVVINGTGMLVTGVVSSKGFKVSGDYHTATSWAREAPWNTTGMTRRLYRTAGTNGSWQLVAENISTTSYTDTLTDAQILGDEYISAGWEPPPAGMIGMGVLPSGAHYGFVGNTLCYSEPYQPHAWPQGYRQQCDFPIIGAASYGTAVVCATAAKPYVFDGIEPSSVTGDKKEAVFPCLSKRSVISLGDGVLYASSFGLIFVNASGASVWTKDYYTRKEWEPLNPASMVCAVSESRIFILYKTQESRSSIIVFYPEEGVQSGLSMTPIELYSDPINGKLYLVFSDGVYEHNASDTKSLSYEWKSKEYELPNPVNFSVCKVDMAGFFTSADVLAAQTKLAAAIAANNATIASKQGNLGGSLDGAADNAIAFNGPMFPELPIVPDQTSVTFDLYVNGQLKFTRVVNTNEAFRLPAGYKADNVAIRLSGNVARVRSVKMAESMTELKQV